jgi:hypothetical protein
MYVNTSAMNNMTYAMPWSMVDPWLIGGTAGACACACTAAGNRTPIRQTNKTTKTANRTIVPVISSPPASRKLVVFFTGSRLIKKEEWSAVLLLSHLCHFPSPPPLEQNRPIFFSPQKRTLALCSQETRFRSQKLQMRNLSHQYYRSRKKKLPHNSNENAWYRNHF